MQAKTIAFYNRQYPGGGGETVTHNLAHYFHAHGLRIIIYTSQLLTDILPPDDRDTFTFHSLPDSSHSSNQTNTEFLCRSLRQEQVDCLIVQGSNQLPFAAIREQVNCRIVFCLHSIPLCEVHIARHRTLAELGNPTLLNKLEFLLLRKPMDKFTNKQTNRCRRIYSNILPHIDRLVMLCPEYRDEMAHLLCREDKKDACARKLIAIPNPLPPAVPPVEGIPKEKIVLYVGRLMRLDKRVDRLLKIWKRVELRNPDWKLQILGRGEEMESLKNEAAQLGIRNAEFLGHQTDVTPYYRRASFICLTSNFEGLPMCLIEAQQYGVIPVSFDSFSAIRGITEGGRAGIMVPAFSKRKYTNMLSAAITDVELQERLREASYVAHQKYAIEKIGQQWLRLFNEL